MQKLLLAYYHSENRATSQIWKVLPNMVVPRLGGKKWRRSERAHASYPGLFVRPPGFSPYMGREERRVQGLDYLAPSFSLDHFCVTSFTSHSVRSGLQQPNKNIDACISNVNIDIKTSGKVKRKLEHINDDIRILGIVLKVALVPVLYREYEYRLFCSFSSPRLIFHQDARRTNDQYHNLVRKFCLG